MVLWFLFYFFFFKQKTAYEMRISDWSSDVCSSDLVAGWNLAPTSGLAGSPATTSRSQRKVGWPWSPFGGVSSMMWPKAFPARGLAASTARSEDHTSELQSLIRISYAVFCLHKKNPHLLPYRLLFTYMITAHL